MPSTGRKKKSGTAGTAGTKSVDREALKKLVAGHAKVGRRPASTKRRSMPWEEHDPDEPADKAMNFRTNAYDRALLKYVAGLRGQSVQAALRELMRAAALAEADG